MSDHQLPKKVHISKETIKRLVTDVRQIMKHPLHDNGIYYQHDQEDMLKGRAVIIGPKDTPYQYGYYLFYFRFPSDYPHAPPKVKFLTFDGNTRFNPNLYVSGKVCVSILNTWQGDQWSGCQSISSILLTLCSLLNEKPLLNEPGITETHKDFDNYNKIVQYRNYDTAIVEMITNHLHIDKPLKSFMSFKPIIMETFLKNAPSILKDIHDQRIQHGNETKLSTSLYNMFAKLSYDDLHSKMEALYKKCLNEQEKQQRKKTSETKKKQTKKKQTKKASLSKTVTTSQP